MNRPLTVSVACSSIVLVAVLYVLWFYLLEPRGEDFLNPIVRIALYASSCLFAIYLVRLAYNGNQKVVYYLSFNVLVFLFGGVIAKSTAMWVLIAIYTVSVALLFTPKARRWYSATNNEHTV